MLQYEVMANGISIRSTIYFQIIVIDNCIVLQTQQILRYEDYSNLAKEGLGPA